MDIFVVYDRSGIHSGRALGEGLSDSVTPSAIHKIEMGRPDRLARLISSGQEFDYVVNVGCFGSMKTGRAIVLNKPGAIGTSSNKLRARQKFVEHGISAPKLWQDPHAIPDKEFPVIARTTHHSKGRGFWFCKNTEEAIKAATPGTAAGKVLITTRKGNRVWRDGDITSSGATHFIKYIPNTREFRVHVMARTDDTDFDVEDMSILKISEKVPGDEGSKSDIIKNVDNGWVFSFPEDLDDPVMDLVRMEAKKAISAFKLHWGAVDIVLSNGKVYVLEINSTPCLTDDTSNTIDKYIKGIRRLMGLQAAKRIEKSTRSIVPLLSRVGL